MSKDPSKTMSLSRPGYVIVILTYMSYPLPLDESRWQRRAGSVLCIYKPPIRPVAMGTA